MTSGGRVRIAAARTRKAKPSSYQAVVSAIVKIAQPGCCSHGTAPIPTCARIWLTTPAAGANIPEKIADAEAAENANGSEKTTRKTPRPGIHLRSRMTAVSATPTDMAIDRHAIRIVVPTTCQNDGCPRSFA